MTRQQIYASRHELKKNGRLFSTADTVFLPITAPERMEAALVEATMERPPEPAPQMEVVLASGVPDMHEGIDGLSALAQDVLASEADQRRGPRVAWP